MQLSIPTAHGRTYTVALRDVTDKELSIVVEAEGFSPRAYSLHATSMFLHVDCAERFNQLMICPQFDGTGCILGVRIVSMRRGVGKYAVETDVAGENVTVLYDKLETPAAKLAWRGEMSRV